MTDDEMIEATRRMFRLWAARDWDGVVDQFASDGVLHSMMSDPVVGHDAIAAVLAGFKDSIESLSFEIERIGVIDGAVVTVRVDSPIVEGRQGSWPAVGVFEFDDDGKVRLWREYFDRAQMLHEMQADSDWM